MKKIKSSKEWHGPCPLLGMTMRKLLDCRVKHPNCEKEELKSYVTNEVNSNGSSPHKQGIIHLLTTSSPLSCLYELQSFVLFRITLVTRNSEYKFPQGRREKECTTMRHIFHENWGTRDHNTAGTRRNRKNIRKTQLSLSFSGDEWWVVQSC